MNLLRKRKNDCVIVIWTLFLCFFLQDLKFCYTFALGNKCKTIMN